MSPAELLDSKAVHSISSAAIVLDLKRRNGEPYRAAVHQLIRAGSIRLVDPDAPITRWTISSAELARYIEHGPRRGADVVPIRDAQGVLDFGAVS